MIANPPGKQLSWMILLLAVLTGFLCYFMARPGYFSPSTPVTGHMLTLVIILLAVATVKQIFRILKGGPSLVVDEKGIFFYTNFIYGKTFLPWEEIAGIHGMIHKSPRGITFRSLKIVPADYTAFLDNFSFLRQIVIRLANLGTGKEIDIPQLMLDKKIKEIIEAIESLNIEQLKKIQIKEEKK